MSSVTIWIVCIFIGIETFSIRSLVLQMVGFLFLLVWNFTYNEMIEWRLFGSNKKMSKYNNIGLKKSLVHGEL